MTQKNTQSDAGWVWKAYLVVITFFLVRKGRMIFDHTSNEFLYYFFLDGLNSTFYIEYFFHVGQVFLNITHFIPLFFYIYRIKMYPAEFWQSLLMCKIIFDITGHNYELQYLESLYYANPLTCVIVTITSIVTYIPLYVGCYRYAFRQETIFNT